MPKKGKITLCIDRTEWDFGRFQCNILKIVAKCKDITIPLYWELLDNKSGNSNTKDRINLLKKCTKLLGVKRIDLFLGDREFIEHEWLRFLKSKGILFCVRVPKHHKIIRSTDLSLKGDKIEDLLNRIGKRKILRITGCRVDGVWGNIYAKKLNEDILFLFGTAKTEFLGQFYKKRWTIESFFQNIKKCGFIPIAIGIEDTHLNQAPKLKKLIAMVCIAYSFAPNMGLYHHKRVKRIPTKNHGYKENSFSRKGINIIRSALNREWKKHIQYFLDFIIRFLRWIELNPNRISLTNF